VSGDSAYRSYPASCQFPQASAELLREVFAFSCKSSTLTATVGGAAIHSLAGRNAGVDHVVGIGVSVSPRDDVTRGQPHSCPFEDYGEIAVDHKVTSCRIERGRNFAVAGRRCA